MTDQLKLAPQSFEKDDDSNGHIDFITAASVGDACMIFTVCIHVLRYIQFKFLERITCTHISHCRPVSQMSINS